MSAASPKHYRPEIDGLRALAVIPVVFYHLGLGPKGGYTGVDIFFVISGYLITGIILRELEHSKFSIANFYKRRVLRIIPAFIAVLIGTLIAAWYLFLPYEMEQLGKHLSAVALMISNIWLEGKVGDYWAPAAETFPLLHTWSLAVEEQFYVFMPLLLIALYHWQKKHLHHWILGICLISFGYCILQTETNQSAAFYLLPSRSWELLIGSLIAIYSQKSSEKRNHNLISNLTAFTFPGYAALLPTIGTACIIFSNRSSRNVVGSLLAWTPFRLIGLISYSLYLWHWPLIVFLKSYKYPESISLMDQSMIFAASIILSILTWKFIEQPFRGEKKQQSPIWVNLTGGLVLLGIVAVSLAIRKLDGYPARFEQRVSPSLYRVIESDVLDKNGSNRFQAKASFLEGGIQHDVTPQQSPKWVIIGDSHGAMMAPMLKEIATEKRKPSAFFTQDGHNILTESPQQTTETIKGYIQSWNPEITFVVLRWDLVFMAKSEEQTDRIADWLRSISQSSGRVEVTLQVPMISQENLRTAKILYNRSRKNGGELPKLKETEQAKKYRALSVDFLESLKLPNLSINDISKPFLDGDSIIYHADGQLFYRDNDHLNVFGTQKAKNLFLKIE